jgi:hypothetical protein
VEITSQNHNFAVDPHTLPPGVAMSHVNLNDGVCEGIRADGLRAFGVQYHPEAGPGPHDSRYLFAQFAAAMADPEAFFGGRPVGLAVAVAAVSGYEPPGLPVPEVRVGEAG